MKEKKATSLYSHFNRRRRKEKKKREEEKAKVHIAMDHAKTLSCDRLTKSDARVRRPLLFHCCFSPECKGMRERTRMKTQEQEQDVKRQACHAGLDESHHDYYILMTFHREIS